MPGDPPCRVTHHAGSPTMLGHPRCTLRAGRQEGSFPAALPAFVLSSHCTERQRRRLLLLLSFWPSLGAATSLAAVFSYRKSITEKTFLPPQNAMGALNRGQFLACCLGDGVLVQPEFVMRKDQGPSGYRLESLGSRGLFYRYGALDQYWPPLAVRCH